MSELALTDSKVVTATPRYVKAARIPPRIRRAIDALVFGEAKTQKDAAALAGMNADHLCRQLKNPQIEAFYEQRVRQSISRMRMRAGARIGELLDAASEHVSLDAAKHVLAIGGIEPARSGGISVNINNNIAAGYVVDLGASASMVDASQMHPSERDSNDV